jgi:hypothetical protein
MHVPRFWSRAKSEIDTSEGCRRYERAAEGRATCRYIGTVGSGWALPELSPLIDVHDRATRCETSLPLA